ncbi:Flp family type IVb pilin [Virgibacillus siamensis]|uniref:Flp family type IVb pilin n=1 Tax=Virgibacillus siamensis TaxID=480071 RepID=UPI000984D1CE|nr:Flp family type IVb pilin [Virgibacillus siamensis]
MLDRFVGLFKEEEGQGMVEYGLIIGLVAVVVVAALVAVGDELVNIFDEIVKKLKGEETV